MIGFRACLMDMLVGKFNSSQEERRYLGLILKDGDE